MLTENDIGERVVCKEWRGRLESVNGGTITVDIGPYGTWIGSQDGWALAGPVNESAPTTRLRKLADSLCAASIETMPSPAGLRSAARLLVAIATEIEQMRTAEEERADVVALMRAEAPGASLAWEAALRSVALRIEAGDHVAAKHEAAPEKAVVEHCADCGFSAHGTWRGDPFCAEHMRSALEAEDLHGPPAG